MLGCGGSRALAANPPQSTVPHACRQRGRAVAEAPLETLSREQKLLLLKRLRAKLRSLAAALAAKQVLGGAADLVRPPTRACAGELSSGQPALLEQLRPQGLRIASWLGLARTVTASMSLMCCDTVLP